MNALKPFDGCKMDDSAPIEECLIFEAPLGVNSVCKGISSELREVLAKFRVRAEGTAATAVHGASLGRPDGIPAPARCGILLPGLMPSCVRQVAAMITSPSLRLSLPL